MFRGRIWRAPDFSIQQVSGPDWAEPAVHLAKTTTLKFDA